MNTALAIILGLFLLLLTYKLFARPLRLLFKLLINSVIGLILLLLLNFIGGFFNIAIGINLFTVLLSGLLGLPGIALMLILQLVL